MYALLLKQNGATYPVDRESIDGDGQPVGWTASSPFFTAFGFYSPLSRVFHQESMVYLKEKFTKVAAEGDREKWSDFKKIKTKPKTHFCTERF